MIDDPHTNATTGCNIAIFKAAYDTGDGASDPNTNKQTKMV